MNKLTKTLAGVATLAVSAGVLIATGGAASAAGYTPPWEPDSNAVGTITFYDNAGNVITHGDGSTTPFFAYAVGSAAVRAGDTRAQITAATPAPGTSPLLFPTDSISSVTTYPTTGAPPDIQAIETANPNIPVVTGNAGDLSLQYYASTDDPQTSTTTGYVNLYQIRLKTENSSQFAPQYDEAAITIDPTTGAWNQLYPVPQTATSTSLSSSENPSTAGDNVTFSSTVTPSGIAGSVVFTADGTQIGTTQSVTSSVNTVTVSDSALAAGSHSIVATFTPTDTTDDAGSSQTISQVVNPPAPATVTTLVVSGGSTTAATDTTLTATVDDKTSSAGVAAGSVSFYDNGSSTALGTVAGSVSSTPGQYVLDVPGGFSVGTHSIVAKFTPTDLTAHAASQSAPSGFITQAAATPACSASGSSCTDTQYIEGNIPVGTIVISTPYSQQNPLNVGSFALNAAVTEFTANAPFADIKVVDNLSGNKGYAVTAVATDLTDGGTNAGSTIDSQNVGLTNLAATKGTGFTGNVGLVNNPAQDPAVAPGAPGSAGLGVTPKNVFTTDHGTGTLDVAGTLTINAPTSTESGEFTGTILFQVAVNP